MAAALALMVGAVGTRTGACRLHPLGDAGCSNRRPGRKEDDRAVGAKPAAWEVRGAASCAFIYNDNVLGAGTDDIDAFESGSYPFKFVHQSTDRPGHRPGPGPGGAGADIFALGQTRLRLRVKRWMYANNPIKTNTDFDFFARQYIGKRQSLELYLHAAPEQYIRQLTDRSPLVDPETPLEWREFRFQRNIPGCLVPDGFPQSGRDASFFERNYRYYNREFMENDIEAWELRGSLAWTVSPVFSLSGDYSYEDGNGRGLDEVGETVETTTATLPMSATSTAWVSTSSGRPSRRWSRASACRSCSWTTTTRHNGRWWGRSLPPRSP